MAGKKSRNKGARLEREVVNLLKAHEVPAKRISMQETGGIDKGDIEIAECWKAQVKGGGHVPKALYKFLENNEEMAIVKRDRKPWLILMNLEWFLKTFI